MFAAVAVALLGGLVLAASPASALPVQIDWSAEMSGSESGTASGSLGVFEVQTGTELLPLPSTGLSARLVRATPGEDPDVITVSQSGNGGVAFQLTSLNSGQMVQTSPGGSLLFLDSNLSGLVLGPSTARVLFGGSQISSGSVEYSVTLVPEPGTAPLLALGLLALAGARVRAAARTGELRETCRGIPPLRESGRI